MPLNETKLFYKCIPKQKYIFCFVGYFVLNSHALSTISLDIHSHYLLGIYISGAETGLVLLVPSTTNNSVNVIQKGLKIIH